MYHRDSTNRIFQIKIVGNPDKNFEQEAEISFRHVWDGRKFEGVVIRKKQPNMPSTRQQKDRA